MAGNEGGACRAFWDDGPSPEGFVVTCVDLPWFLAYFFALGPERIKGKMWIDILSGIIDPVAPYMNTTHH
jgi:hypothetical protein